MGWFSKKVSHAKILGSEAGQLVRTQIQEEFKLTEFCSNGEFSEPTGFFRDPYVVGFVHGYLVTMADVGSAKRGKHWTEGEKTEFMVSATEEVVGSEGLRAFIGLPRKYNDHEGYKDAYLAANTLIKSIFARAALTDVNHFVSEANILIKERKESLNELLPTAREGDFLTWAVQEISINRHIRSVYLGNNDVGDITTVFTS